MVLATCRGEFSICVGQVGGRLTAKTEDSRQERRTATTFIARISETLTFEGMECQSNRRRICRWRDVDWSVESNNGIQDVSNRIAISIAKFVLQGDRRKLKGPLNLTRVTLEFCRFTAAGCATEP